MRRRQGIAVALGLLAASCLSPEGEVPADCYVGVLTADGGACQTMRGPENDIYSFYADMNGYSLGEEVCICGEPSLMTPCKTGTALDLVHLDRSCPGPPPAY